MTFDLSNACAGMLTGVTVLNNWIRQGIVERGLVVSGEYISPARPECRPPHPHHHEQGTRVPDARRRRSGAAAGACPMPVRPAISLAGFTTVADHSRLCLAYPKGGDPGARMFTDSRGDSACRDRRHPTPAARGARGGRDRRSHDIDHVITHQTSARAIRKGMAEMTVRLRR